MTLRLPVMTFCIALALASGAFASELGQPVDVAFKAEIDGATQYYIEMLPKGLDEAKPHDLLIALHGYTFDRWQVPKMDKPAIRAIKEIAVARDMILISPDYRTNSFMGPKAEADMAQIIREQKKKHKVARVFLVGGSMGGASVLIFTALHPDLVDGVASLNGTANMMEFEVAATTPELKKFSEGLTAAVAASYGGTKAQKPEEYKKRSPELTPGKFKMPIAFVVGAKDPLVPPGSIRRLVAKMQEMGKKDVLLIDRPEGGHDSSAEDTKASLEFIIKAADEKAKKK